MKFTLTITPLVALFSVTSAVNVFYDTRFDNPKGLLSTVACSDGPNGLLTKGFTTFRSLPSFPNIGAAQAVGGWNSSVCGSCWHISFGGKSINVTAIDHTGDGFNLSLEVMNNLTNGHAEEFGVINSQAAQINKKFCGL